MSGWEGEKEGGKDQDVEVARKRERSIGKGYREVRYSLQAFSSLLYIYFLRAWGDRAARNHEAFLSPPPHFECRPKICKMYLLGGFMVLAIF